MRQFRTRPLYVAAFITVALATALLASCSKDSQPAAEASYYTCPMHQQIQISAAGDCPICNMSLVQKSGSLAAATGRITLTDRQIQLGGVRFGRVARRNLVKEIDAPGRIEVDERRIHVVSCWSGRIDELYVDYTGATVRRGDPLFRLYDPDLITEQEQLLVSIQNLETLRSRPPGTVTKASMEHAERTLDDARQRLLWWGLSKEQIAAIEADTEIDSHVTIHAPIDGTVVEKHALPGMYVKQGQPLFKLAGLSEVWMVADVYEHELPLLDGSNARLIAEVTTPALPGEVHHGQIEFVEPFLQRATRATRVRLTIPNPDGRLKPGMYARARLRIQLDNVLSVPASAVLVTGKRHVVMRDAGQGSYEPVLVTLGRSWLEQDLVLTPDDADTLPFTRPGQRFHELLGGLGDGDVVVTSGNFLVASEARLQGAFEKMLDERSR